jgi:hypothetical protein
MEIRFEIDTDRLTFGDMLLVEDAQDGKRQFHTLGALMSRFMVSEDGQPAAEDEAMAVLKKLTVSQSKDVIGAFMEALRAKAIPPQKGGS